MSNAPNEISTGQSSSMSLEQALSGIEDAVSVGADTRLRILLLGKPVTVHPLTREQIYFFVREAVVNALRHSGSRVIKVEVEYLTTRLRVRVQDNGCGLDSGVIQSGRGIYSGLLQLRGRADSITAQFRVWSKQRCGMLVEVAVPIDKVAHASD